MGAGVVPITEESHYAHLIDKSRPWYTKSRLIALNACILLLLITSSTNGYDGSLFYLNHNIFSESLFSDREHDERSSIFNSMEVGLQLPLQLKSALGLLNVIQNIGSLAGYPFAPYMSDGVGRKRTILLGAAIMTAATIIQTASQNIGMFIGARFLIGFGLTFCANAAPLLVSEIAYPPQRAALTSSYNSLWYSGSIVAAWTTYGTFRIASSWSWRIPSAFQGLPSVLQLLLIWFVPESPRWLISKGREQEATEIIAYYHADGNEENPLVTYQIEEIKNAISVENHATENVGYKSLFKTVGNRRRLRVIIALAFFSQWSGNGLISFYQNKVFDALGISGTGTQLLINGILQLWNLGIALVASALVESVGRRKLFICSCVGMLLAWTAQTVCFAEFSANGSAQAAHAFIAFIFLFYAAYDASPRLKIAFTPLIVSYTIEILPYAVRAKGFNIFSFTISLSLILNQYVNPLALARIGWKYYLFYLVWLVIELIFVLRYVIETKNRTLEETAVLFDGDDELEQAAQIVEAHVQNAKSDEAPSNEKTH
ncbi:hexose transporter [Hysterangium stoloniferum]|nr:hexose transporter [Hysterangium stoloniferum]